MTAQTLTDIVVFVQAALTVGLAWLGWRLWRDIGGPK